LTLRHGARRNCAPRVAFFFSRFIPHDQALVRRHAGNAWRSRARRFGKPAFHVSLSSYQQGRHDAVDLTLKMNVLAVCAVFVFVGAILLGAF
jgi:hypothetical protein